MPKGKPMRSKPRAKQTARPRVRISLKRKQGIIKGDNTFNPSSAPSLRYNAVSRVNKATPMAGFPHEYYCVLPYHDIVSISLSTNPWGVHRFRMNSIFDPDYSTGGHQPRGRDEFANLYASYIVYAIGYDINFMTKDTTREACVVGIAGCSSYQTLGSIPNYQALRETNQRFINVGRIDDQKPVTNIKGKLMCRKVEGVDKDTYNDESGPFQAFQTTNPVASPTLAVFAGTIDQTTMSAAVVADVKLLYYCKMFTRTINGPS